MDEHNTDGRWRDLCEAILREPDPQKLQELAGKLNDELQIREIRNRERINSHQAALRAARPRTPET